MSCRSSTAILALLTLPCLASALTIPTPGWPRPRTSPEALFGRTSTCGEAAYVPCSADLPTGFCCPAASTCMALAGHTSALCCPAGSDCTQIQPIPCDLSLEDKSKHPSATVMSSALTGTLATCGTKCCPFGYSCADGVCHLKSDQTAKPETSAAASAATTSSPTQSSAPSQTAGVRPTTATGARPSATSTADATAAAASDRSGLSPSHAGTVAGGVVGGLAGVALLGGLLLLLVKRERKRKATAQAGGSDPRAPSAFGSKAPMAHPEISKPIASETGTWRSDFTRKVSVRDPASLHRGRGGRAVSLDHHHEDDDDDDDDDDDVASHGNISYIEALGGDDVSSMHEVARAPLRIVDPHRGSRTVSSLYGSFYDPNDPARHSAVSPTTTTTPAPQPYLKMPSARAYGGSAHYHRSPAPPTTHHHAASPGARRDWLADPLPVDYYGNGTPRGYTHPHHHDDADADDVFADSNALAPPPLLGAGGGADRDRRETRFSDFARPATGG